MKIKKISVLIIVVALTGCFSYGDRHEAFINTHSGDVGNKIQSFRKRAPPSVGIPTEILKKSGKAMVTVDFFMNFHL